jgi:hypothetical protein
MRRLSDADRGQKQGASNLLGLQNHPQRNNPDHLRALITEAYPKRKPYGHHRIIHNIPRRPLRGRENEFEPC